MKTEEIKIEGMSCHHCVVAVKNALMTLGIENFEVEIGRAKFDYDENSADEETIKAAIEEEGYKVVSSIPSDPPAPSSADSAGR